MLSAVYGAAISQFHTWYPLPSGRRRYAFATTKSGFAPAVVVQVSLWPAVLRTGSALYSWRKVFTASSMYEPGGPQSTMPWTPYEPLWNRVVVTIVAPAISGRAVATATPPAVTSALPDSS